MQIYQQEHMQHNYVRVTDDTALAKNRPAHPGMSYSQS